MPKMKTKSAAKKRFSFTATGRVKAGPAGKRHGMIKRTTKFIRDASRDDDPVAPATRRSSRNTCPTTGKETAPMSRVKSGVVTHARHRKVIKAAKGYYAAAQHQLPHRHPGRRQGQPVRHPRPQDPQAQLPRAVDPADQRCRPAVRRRDDLFALHQRPVESRDRG